jgi:hypothetical protein
MIGGILLDMVGHATARILVPLMSLGRLSVQRVTDETIRHNWFGVGRKADGSLQVEATMAAWWGLFFWIAVLITTLGLLR